MAESADAGSSQAGGSTSVQDGKYNDRAGIAQDVNTAVDHAQGDHGEQNERNAAPRSNPDNLRRTSSKIADLRAAFECRTNASNMLQAPSKRTADKSPARPHEYEAEIARLKRQLDRETEMRQAYEQKCLALEEESRQRDLATELAALGGGRHSLPVTQPQDEIRLLHAQITELKRSMSAATHVEDQLADSTLVSGLEVLHSEIQNWTVQHFRRANGDVSPDAMCARLDSIPCRKQRDLLQPRFMNYRAPSKLAMLQTVICSFLMDVFSDSFLYGLSIEDEWLSSTKKSVELLPTVLPTATFNRWRAVTLNSIRKCSLVADSVDSAAAKLAQDVCICLEKLTLSEGNAARVASLKTIVKRAISLAHLFKAQRACYDFILPETGAPFDVGEMDDISIDAEALPDMPVLCATFPSVTKIGDENGENGHLQSVVLKARVLCVPDV